MKPRMIGVGLALAFIVGGCLRVAETRQAKGETRTSKAINQAGEYRSPDGSCHAVLSTASMGGFLVLTTGNSAPMRLKVENVTGMAWVGGHTLVYTSSPIYGVPGVYAFSCGSNKPKRIVAPRTKSKAYPDGEDFFELEGISGVDPVTVYFYYAPQVDKVDFEIFRTPAFLYQVHLDGGDFRKVRLTPR